MAKLPILMYHDVSENLSKGLTISVDKLEEQFKWLHKNDYHTHFFSKLLESRSLRAKKNVVITFDDGYVSQLEHVLPLLRKFKLKATFFIPLGYLGKTDEWNTSLLPIMDITQIKSLDRDLIELGYHSFQHRKYTEMSLETAVSDTQDCYDLVTANELVFSPILAYPYGKYPRFGDRKEQFFELLKLQEIKYGLRIGNRINRFPFEDPYEIQRLDIKGEYSLAKFRRKLKYGKLF